MELIESVELINTLSDQGVLVIYPKTPYVYIIAFNLCDHDAKQLGIFGACALYQVLHEIALACNWCWETECLTMDLIIYT
jgi:hypothetical protein